MLPEVFDNAAEYGATVKELLGRPVPITGIAGDQQAALIGQACFAPGMVKSTYGTGCFALMNIGGEFRASRNRLLTTIAYRLDGQICYAVEGSIFVAGATVQWLRDSLGIVKSAAETEQIVKSVPDNNGVYLVPAFTGLGAPYWRPDARGLVSGLTRGATAAHLVRAGLEAQAYQTQDLMAAMADDAGHPIAEIRVDGGMVKNDWICQFIADVTRKKVLRPQVVETTALGAAYLAGLGAGIFDSTDQIAAAWQEQRAFTAEMDAKEAARLYDGWQVAIRQALAGCA
jgi:glycerol kinase